MVPAAGLRKLPQVFKRFMEGRRWDIGNLGRFLRHLSKGENRKIGFNIHAHFLTCFNSLLVMDVM